jgi:hypothetical protein
MHNNAWKQHWSNSFGWSMAWNGYAIHMCDNVKGLVYYYELWCNHNYQLSKVGKYAFVCGIMLETNGPIRLTL